MTSGALDKNQAEYLRARRVLLELRELDGREARTLIGLLLSRKGRGTVHRGHVEPLE
jgi:hypothetical protein